jgi:predicted PurR-regulated permease PerM
MQTKPMPPALLAVLLVVIALAMAGLLIVSIQVLLLVFAGVLFGLFLNRVSHALSDRTPLSYRPAYTVVIVVLLLVAIGGGYYAGSRVIAGVGQLAGELSDAVESLNDQLMGSSWGRQYSDLVSQAESMFTNGGGILPEVLTVAGSLVWGTTAVVVILFVGFYVAFDPHLYQTGLLMLVSPPRRDRAREVIAQLQAALVGWIVGRLISMSLVAIATAIGLALLGVPLPITLGVVAGLLTFIPNIGPVLAAVPQALLAFQVGPSTVLYVLLFNFALQAMESYLITPVVLQKEASMPPALTISAQLLMTVLVGAIGIFMAAPLTVVVMVLLRTLYINDTLGDAGAEQAGPTG